MKRDETFCFVRRRQCSVDNKAKAQGESYRRNAMPQANHTPSMHHAVWEEKAEILAI